MNKFQRNGAIIAIIVIILIVIAIYTSKTKNTSFSNNYIQSNTNEQLEKIKRENQEAKNEREKDETKDYGEKEQYEEELNRIEENLTEVVQKNGDFNRP